MSSIPIAILNFAVYRDDVPLSAVGDEGMASTFGRIHLAQAASSDDVEQAPVGAISLNNELYKALPRWGCGSTKDISQLSMSLKELALKLLQASRGGVKIALFSGEYRWQDVENSGSRPLKEPVCTFYS